MKNEASLNESAALI